MLGLRADRIGGGGRLPTGTAPDASRRPARVSPGRATRLPPSGASIYPESPVGGRRFPGCGAVRTAGWDPNPVAATTTTTVLEPAAEEVWARDGRMPASLKLGEVMGRGTFGVVREAICERTGRRLAVKVLSKRRPGYSKKQLRARIENEVSVWTELLHCKDVATLHACYEDDDHVYLVQERCAGGSLGDILKEREYVTEPEAATLVASILRMLSECHSRSICYGDVKPANFLLPRGGTGPETLRRSADLKAVDFGSAQRTRPGEARLMAESGTPLYMAPEVQAPPYGLESDVWSVGILLYQLLSGTPPFVSSVARTMMELTPASLAYAIAYVKLKFEGEVWKSISPDAKDLISKMLQRDISSRISADEALNHPWILANTQIHDPQDLNKASRGNIVESTLKVRDTV